ncbi:MAG: SPFH domain-containing protein, partial [Thermoanaerobaculia bacterium]
VVISLGRRTNDVRHEGLTWLPPLVSRLVSLYVRERQIDVAAAEYYTSDRVRLSFKTTLRVVVKDPVALFDQGPGTYTPFMRPDLGEDTGSEEKNVALLKLVQNSIRESVQSMGIADVMFGSLRTASLRERIQLGLAQTVQRWGLSVVEVWLTEIDAEDGEVKRAVQAEVRQGLEGRGQLAADAARIAKGALFGRAAQDVVDQIRQETGREVPIEEVANSLFAFYQNERALDIAMKSAGGTNELMNLFYMQQMGAPVPARVGGGLGIPTMRPVVGSMSVGSQVGGDNRSWIIGREGDLVIDGDGVSRHHARLDSATGTFSLTDLGSTNGTFINDTQLEPNRPSAISADDKVRFGKSVAMKGRDLLDGIRGGRVDLVRHTQPGR